MASYRVFLMSGARSADFAAALRQGLEVESHEVSPWDCGEVGPARFPPDELLRRVARQYDFAVIVLSQSDLEPGTGLAGGADPCRHVYTTAYLRALMGRERCPILYAGAPDALPSDLQDAVIRVPTEQAWADSQVRQHALPPLLRVLADVFASLGKKPSQVDMPLFSVRDLFARERPRSENGDLDEGSVMVCDIQPLAGAEFAARVGANIRSGINYLYFFHACDDTIEQVFRALQIIVVSGVAPEVDLNDVQARRAVVKEKTHLVVEALQDMCETKGLRIGFLYQEPNFCFRLHNAQDAKRARLYARYRDLGYVLWAKEEAAAALLRAPADFLEDREDTTILVQLKAGGPQLSADADIMRSLADKVRKYFPGAEDAVMQICVGSTGR